MALSARNCVWGAGGLVGSSCRPVPLCAVTSRDARWLSSLDATSARIGGVKSPSPCDALLTSLPQGLNAARGPGLLHSRKRVCRSSAEGGKGESSEPGGAGGKSTAPPGGETQPEQLETVEATHIIEEGDKSIPKADTLASSSFERLPDSEDSMIKTVYTGLMALHAVVGASLVAAAIVAPSVLIPEAACGTLCAAMVGILGAALLRSASLILFIQESLARGELGTMRIQRINLAFIIFGIVTATSVLPGVTAAPLLTIPMLLMGAITAGASLQVLKLSQPLRPFLQFSWVPGDLLESATRWLHLISRDVTTVAGALSYVAMASALFGAFGLLLDIGSWQSCAVVSQLVESSHGREALGAGGIDGTVAVVAVLRRLVGCGMVLAAATSHVLLDFCDHVRVPQLMEAIYNAFQESMMAKDPILSFFNPPKQRYNTLHVGAAVATVVQAYFLWIAPGQGVNVNIDASCWGPLYVATCMWLLYLPVAAAQVDWRSLKRSMGAFLGAFTGLIAWLYDHLVLNWETTKDLRSRSAYTTHMENTWLKNVKLKSD